MCVGWGADVGGEAGVCVLRVVCRVSCVVCRVSCVVCRVSCVCVCVSCVQEYYIVYEEGDKTKHTYPVRDGDANAFYSNGDRFSGIYADGEKMYGVYNFKNGSIFCGNFREGVRARVVCVSVCGVCV